MRSKRAEEPEEMDVMVKDEDHSGEMGSECTVEDPYLIQVTQQDDGCQEMSEEPNICKKTGKRVRSKGQLWQFICSLASEEHFQKWKQDAGKLTGIA